MSTQAPARKTLKKHHVVEFVKFGLVGFSGVLVNQLVFIIASKIIPLDEHVALLQLWPTEKNFRAYHLFATIGFLVANIWNFEINRAWTFGKGGRSSRKRFGRYFLIGVAALLVGLWLMSLLLSPSSPIALPRDVFDGSTGLRTAKYWANLIQVLATVPISFVLQKLWTFAAHEEPAPAAPEAQDLDGAPRA